MRGATTQGRAAPRSARCGDYAINASTVGTVLRYWLPTARPASVTDRRVRLHINDFPDVAAQVLEPVLIHLAIVPGLSVGAPPRRNSFPNQFIHILAAAARQCEYRLGRVMGIADRPGRKLLELGQSQQHHIDVIADDHTSRGVIRILRVDGVSECSVERHGLARSLTGRLTKIKVSVGHS